MRPKDVNESLHGDCALNVTTTHHGTLQQISQDCGAQTRQQRTKSLVFYNFLRSLDEAQLLELGINLLLCLPNTTINKRKYDALFLIW